MKLFTKEINNKLFKQYQEGNNLDNQMVVAKIFNPYGKGRWFLINSDPQDPDYLWAIVQMGDIVEVGSVLRSELESIRVSPFKFPLERDLGFSQVNAGELLRGLEQGKFYKKGGTLYAASGMEVGRYYKDKGGNSYRYIGENTQGQTLFNDGERVIIKSTDDFEEEPKEKRRYGFFEDGGETEEGVDLFEDYENIPSNVQVILDKYAEEFEDGSYKGLAKALKELEKIGYTFEYGLDGGAYDLRKIGQKGKNEDDYANGGFVEKTDEELKGMNDDELFEYLDAKAAYMKQYTRPLSSYKAKNFAANATAVQFQNEGTSKLDENFPNMSKIREQSMKDYQEGINKIAQKRNKMSRGQVSIGSEGMYKGGAAKVLKYDDINKMYAIKYLNKNGEVEGNFVMARKDDFEYGFSDFDPKMAGGGFTSSFSGTPDRRRVTMAKGGELNGTIAGDAAKYIAEELSYYVKSVDEQPYNGTTIFYVKDKESVNKTIKALKDLYGIEATAGYVDFTGMKSVKFYNDQIVETNNEMAMGGKLKDLLSRAKSATKKGYDKTKEYTKKQIHDQKKKIALDVIDETIYNYRNDENELRQHLAAAEELIEEGYAKGGEIGSLKDYLNKLINALPNSSSKANKNKILKEISETREKIKSLESKDKMAKGGEMVYWETPYGNTTLKFKGKILEDKGNYYVVEYNNYESGDMNATTHVYKSQVVEEKMAKGGEVSISEEDYEFYVGGDEYEGKAIKEDGVIVGGIAYDEEDAEIKGITVKNKFRKRGIAKKAVKEVFNRDKKLKSVYIRATPRAKKFWMNIGTNFDNYNKDAGLWEGTLNRFADGGKVKSAKELWNDMSVKERMDFLKVEYKDKITNDDLLLKRLEGESKKDWDDLAIKIQMEFEKMAMGGMLGTIEQVMTFEEFKKKLPILHDIKAGDNGVEYKPKYNKYTDTIMYFKNGRTNSEKVSLSEAYKHYKYFLEKGEEYASGGKVKFQDKVKEIKASLLKTKKVPKKVQKDYGKTYNAKEAELAAKRIAGAMAKKSMK